MKRFRTLALCLLLILGYACASAQNDDINAAYQDVVRLLRKQTSPVHPEFKQNNLEAEKLLSALIEKHPDDARLYIRRAQTRSALELLCKENDKRDELKTLEKADIEKAKALDANCLEVIWYTADKEKEWSILGECIKRNPNFIDAYESRMAVGIFNNEIDPEIVLQDATKAIELEPDNPDNYSARGWVYMLRLDPKDGLPDAQKAIELGGNDIFTYDLLGTILIAHERYGEAIDAYTKATKAYGNEFDPLARYARRGMAKLNLKDYTGAIADSKLALENNIDGGAEATAYETLIRSLSLRDDYDEANVWIEKGLKKPHMEKEILTQAALNAMQHAKLDKVLFFSEILLEKYPEYFVGYWGKLIALNAQKHFDEIESFLPKCEQFIDESDSLRMHFCLGKAFIALHKQKKFEKAERDKLLSLLDGCKAPEVRQIMDYPLAKLILKKYSNPPLNYDKELEEIKELSKNIDLSKIKILEGDLVLSIELIK